jgi:hypothetical protein
MSFIKDSEEKLIAKKEYDAIKKHLGEMLLEHNSKEENPEEWSYFNRKFEEARKKLKRTL